MLLSPITHYNQYRVQRGRLYRFENMIHGEDIICLLSFIKINLQYENHSEWIWKFP